MPPTPPLPPRPPRRAPLWQTSPPAGRSWHSRTARPWSSRCWRPRRTTGRPCRWSRRKLSSTLPTARTAPVSACPRASRPASLPAWLASLPRPVPCSTGSRLLAAPASPPPPRSGRRPPTSTPRRKTGTPFRALPPPTTRARATLTSKIALTHPPSFSLIFHLVVFADLLFPPYHIAFTLLASLVGLDLCHNDCEKMRGKNNGRTDRHWQIPKLQVSFLSCALPPSLPLLVKRRRSQNVEYVFSLSLLVSLGSLGDRVSCRKKKSINIHLR